MASKKSSVYLKIDPHGIVHRKRRANWATAGTSSGLTYFPDCVSVIESRLSIDHAY